MKQFLAVAASIGLLAFASVAVASPRVGQTLPLTLSPNDEVTISPRDSSWRVVAVRGTSLDPEIPPADRNQTTETMRRTDTPIRFTTPQGTLRFTFWSNPREGAWLKLENNLGRPIIYSAEIAVRGQSGFQATSICSVNGGVAAYELWPDDVTAIRITGFYRAPASGRVCGNPERGDIGAPPPTVSAPSNDKSDH